MIIIDTSVAKYVPQSERVKRKQFVNCGCERGKGEGKVGIGRGRSGTEEGDGPPSIDLL